MRRLFLSVVLAATCVALAPAPASASPPSTDPATAAAIAATWVAHQVNAQGFIPQAGDPNTPNLSNSAQAVVALAAAGVGRSQVDALLGYLGDHVDDFVVRSGNDDPGALAYLVLGAVAAGDDPHDFGSGHADLVARLEATEQPDGLFGANDPTFDGAFRQGLALLALHAAGASSATAVAWLVDQQCNDGLWTSFRSDTTVACPAVDPSTFSGPDTNSTALAMLGLEAQGSTAPADDGASALDGVRNGDGAWGFLAASDQATDANSTGLVTAALRAVNGTQDARGVAALLALQVGCDGEPADVGGIAFQSSPDGLVPDLFATNQAILALAGVVLPQSDVAISPDLAEPCVVADTTTTTTTTVSADPAVEGTSASPTGLARTGEPTTIEAALAFALLGVGAAAMQLAHHRRRRLS